MNRALSLAAILAALAAKAALAVASPAAFLDSLQMPRQRYDKLSSEGQKRFLANIPKWEAEDPSTAKDDVNKFIIWQGILDSQR